MPRNTSPGVAPVGDAHGEQPARRSGKFSKAAPPPPPSLSSHSLTPPAALEEPVVPPTQKPARKQHDLLRDSLAYVIKRAQVRCDESLTEYLESGISPARLAALSTIGANPGISQAALGGLLNIAGPSVVKVVDELQRMELVRREPSSDRRVYALQLTEKGAADLKRYQAAIRSFENKISAQLTREERALLIALLAKVAPDEA